MNTRKMTLKDYEPWDPYGEWGDWTVVRVEVLRRSCPCAGMVQLVPLWPEEVNGEAWDDEDWGTDRHDAFAEVWDNSHTKVLFNDRESFRQAYQICRGIRRGTHIVLHRCAERLQILQIGTGVEMTITAGFQSRGLLETERNPMGRYAGFAEWARSEDDFVSLTDLADRVDVADAGRRGE